jgi:predicted amidohydrolase YtcJ
MDFKTLLLRLSVFLMVHFPCSSSFAQEADLILHHGKIVTMDKQFRIQEAIALKGNRILRVGSNQHVLKARGDHTEILDLGGKTVLPGLIDSHVHPSDACVGGI